MRHQKFFGMTSAPRRRMVGRRLGTRLLLLAGMFLVLGLAPLLGQINVGSIVGTVADQSGGVVVGATVTAVNPATNERRTTRTNSLGEYVFYDLPPATYNITVEYPGFKTTTRENIPLHVAEKLRVELVLEPGAVTQTVEVKGAAPLLQPETSSLGTVVTEQTISAMPLNGRNVYDLVALTPGVSPTPSFGSYGVPYGGGGSGGLNGAQINGGRDLTNSFMLDDTDNIVSGYNNIGVVPTLDAVQEFNVLTNSFAAKYGRSGGGIVTAVTKGGTNDFHGDLWEFVRNDKLDANGFFSNQVGSHLPPFRQNQFGGSAGGPLRRNKTFWFGSYEGFRYVKGAQGFLTVPTDLQKAGDFSQTYTYDANGNPALMKIYNPFTTTVDANGNFVRQQFPGNVIPPSLFDPVSKNTLQYYPEPNLVGDPVTHANNFFYSAPNRQVIDSYLGRIDENISERQRLFGRYDFTRYHSIGGNQLGNIADEWGATTLNRTQGLTLSYTNTLSATTVLNVRYGFVRQTSWNHPSGFGFDESKLGFPASLIKQLELPGFPEIDVAGFTSIGTFIFYNSHAGGTTNSLAANLSKVIGRHSIEAGIDLRLIQGFDFAPGWPSGEFSFDAGFTHGPEANNADPTSGNGFASFLLGTDGTNYASYDPHWFFTNRYYAGYFQDDIKVNRKLTVNLGLRYDYESPYHDRYNQLSWPDYKAQIPITGVPQINIPGFGLLPKEPFMGGGAMFPNVSGSGPVQVPQRKDFGPRVGLAYSITPKTVIRTAYGIIYPGSTADNSGNFPTVQGFNPITQTSLAPDGYTPLQRPDRGFFLSNPYPNGLRPASGSSLGLLTSLGNNDQGLEHIAKHAYFQQWNFGIQRQLPADVLVEAAYVGSHGVHLADYQGSNYNQMPDQYLALGNSLFNSYPNPFLGVLPANSTIGSLPTLTLQQLLVPYPEFTAATEGPDYQTSSNYNGLQLKVQKRTSHGLTLLAAYTASKILDTASSTGSNYNGTQGHQDFFNRKLDYSIGSQDRSQILVLSPTYQLPFGRGKPIGGGISNRVISQAMSGWEVSSILTFTTGFPIGIGCVVCPGPANRPDLIGNPNQGIHGSNESRLNHWFNTAAFAPNPPFHYGTTPRILPATRGPGTKLMDFSLIKDTTFMERYRLQFRFESFNFLNHPNFGQPDAGFGDTTFGVISSTVGTPREIQFGMKLYW